MRIASPGTSRAAQMTATAGVVLRKNFLSNTSLPPASSLADCFLLTSLSVYAPAEHKLPLLINLNVGEEHSDRLLTHARAFVARSSGCCVETRLDALLW